MCCWGGTLAFSYECAVPRYPLRDPFFNPALDVRLPGHLPSQHRPCKLPMAFSPKSHGRCNQSLPGLPARASAHRLVSAEHIHSNHLIPSRHRYVLFPPNGTHLRRCGIVSTEKTHYNFRVAIVKIANVVKKYKISEQPNNYAFWKSKSYEERLDALEQIRKEYNSWKYNAESGLQRVYRIVKQK